MLLIGLLCLSACSSKADKPIEHSEAVSEPVESTPVESSESEVVPEAEPTEAAEEIPVIYEDNAVINLYLNRFNEADPEAQISGEDFEPYYHHGQTHKNQIVFQKGSEYELVISDLSLDRVKVVGNAPTKDELKAVFLKYAKGYSLVLSAEDLESYWDQVISSGTKSFDFPEFKVMVQSGYVWIEGAVQ